MRATWKRIDEWLRVNAPQVLNGLQPGANQEEIERAEDFFGIWIWTSR